MATKLQDKINERASVWANMVEIMDRTDSAPTGEDAAAYDRAEAEFDRLETEIQRLENHANRSAGLGVVNRAGVVPPAFGGPENSQEDEYERVFSQFLREGQGELDSAERAILRGGFVDAKSGGFRNAAGVGTGAAGGYAVPPLFRDKFVEAMKYFGPMLNLVELIRTDSGATLPWPTNDDTANVGAILAENTAVTELDVALGTANLDVYMYTSRLVRASFQLLNDAPDFEAWLPRKLGERIGRALNAHWTTGTGTAQPLGIVPGGVVGVTGTGSFASTGGITGDNLIDLVESLDPAYGASQNLRWMMHQSVRRAVRKLKDGQQRYLFEPALTAGTPDTLFGYGMSLNNDMPTLAASSKSLLFGDIREAYVGRIVNDLTTMRLTERYADFLQVGFLSFERAGGTVQNTAAYRVFQTTATA